MPCFDGRNSERIVYKEGLNPSLLADSQNQLMRAYGNAINAEAAKEFIKIGMEYLL